MKAKSLFLFICIYALGFAQTNLEDIHHLTIPFQAGDMIFQDLDCEICDAIELVTQKEGNPYSFSHMALIVEVNGKLMALEAIGNQVKTTEIDVFTQRSKNAEGQCKVVHVRLRKPFSHLNEKAIEFARAKVGKPYDDAFEYGNASYYCSELIYDAYLFANDGQPFFQLRPMTFKQPNSNLYFDAWVDYFKKLDKPIPEGKLGCNPNGIFDKEKFEVIQAYY